MKSAARGNAAEAAVLNELIRRGFDVLVPFGGGHPYDLVVDVEGTGFLRIQCKRAWELKGCVLFNARSTDHGRGPQSYLGLAELFGVYFPPRDQVYLVPIDGVAAFGGRLRLEPTRNNQKRGIRFAADFEIDQWTEDRLAAMVPAARAPAA
jgi:PD-(D/E)XK endonuclease